MISKKDGNYIQNENIYFTSEKQRFNSHSYPNASVLYIFVPFKKAVAIMSQLYIGAKIAFCKKSS